VRDEVAKADLMELYLQARKIARFDFDNWRKFYIDLNKDIWLIPDFKQTLKKK
jgi:hypothetical protein